MERLKINTTPTATAITIGKVTFKRDITVAWLTIFPATVIDGKTKQTHAMITGGNVKLTASDPGLIKQLKSVAELGDVGMSSGKRPFIKGKNPLKLTGATIEGEFVRSVDSIEVAKFTPVVDAELDAELAAYIAENTKKEAK